MGQPRGHVIRLQRPDKYETVSDAVVALSEADLDVGVFEEHSLREYDTEIRERKADDMLPVLPDGSDTGVETLDRREGTETEPAVSQFVDEDLTTPLGTVELRERLDTLGRIRITMPHDDSGTPSDQRNAVLDRTDQGLDHPVAGLGLSLVDTPVAEYGGTLQISDADSGGVSTEVELPERVADWGECR